jgi:phage baseplate assembly protein W
MEILTATKNATSVVFSDVNLDVNTESPLELVYNEDSINKSIITILGTKKFSRVFRRDFGSELQDILFDPMDDMTVLRIKRELIEAIERWENRIILKKAEVLPDYPNQQYYVELVYVIPALGNKTASFTFNLKSGG